MPDTVLVCGGAGFVGSSIALALRQRAPEFTVVALDNLRRRGSELALPRLKAAGVQFLHGDIRHAEDLEGLEPGVIVECSAEPSVLAGYYNSPDYLVHTNLTGAYHCLELARRTRADVVFLSTSRVYPTALINGLAFAEEETRYRLLDQQAVPGASAAGINEDFPTRGARSLYGMTKLASELMIEEYGDAFGLRYVINRCGLIAGPWQMGKSDQGVVTLWAARHHFQQPLSYIGFGGLGKQVRDVLHIDDLTELVLRQIREMDTFTGQILNVGGGLEFSLSLREMTQLCLAVTGRRVGIDEDAKDRKSDVRVYISDLGKIERTHGWRPRRCPRTVIEDISGWIAANESQLRPILAAEG